MKTSGVSLVIGADGLIGRALVEHLEHVGTPVIETTRRKGELSERKLFLDLAEDISDWYPPSQVSTAYLYAAGSSLRRCRAEPAQTARVNVENTVALAKKLVSNGTFVIFPSTNLVFDGTVPYRNADAPLCPITEYGRQKALAERELLALGNLVSVVRMTKVLEQQIPLFKGWMQSFENCQLIHPFSDMVVAPVSLGLAIRVFDGVASARLPGLLQVSGQQDVTYAQIGRHIAKKMGVDCTLVEAKSWRESGLDLEAVPNHTTLDTSRLRAELGIELMDVWTTIDTMLGL